MTPLAIPISFIIFHRIHNIARNIIQGGGTRNESLTSDSSNFKSYMNKLTIVVPKVEGTHQVPRGIGRFHRHSMCAPLVARQTSKS